MIISDFQNIFNDCELQGHKIIIKSSIVDAISCLKNNYHFNVLKEITAIDNQEQGIELIYNLYSTEDEEDVLISSFVNNETESISVIFDSAVADEKEIYDLFGIKFKGNSELKRLYMPESWKGYPLRKDYTNDDERLRWNE